MLNHWDDFMPVILLFKFQRMLTQLCDIMVFSHNVEFPIFHNVGWLSSTEKPKPCTGAVLCKQRMMFVSRGINVLLFLACNQKCTVATILACRGPPALLLSISARCSLTLLCVLVVLELTTPPCRASTPDIDHHTCGSSADFLCLFLS